MMDCFAIEDCVKDPPKKRSTIPAEVLLNDSETLFIINYHYIPGSSLSVKGPFVSLPYFIIFSLSNAKGFIPRREIRSTYIQYGSNL